LDNSTWDKHRAMDKVHQVKVKVKSRGWGAMWVCSREDQDSTNRRIVMDTDMRISEGPVAMRGRDDRVEGSWGWKVCCAAGSSTFDKRRGFGEAAGFAKIQS
jgi:hypothetical protein